MSKRVRKPAAILLLVAFIFMLVPAQAETPDTTGLFGTLSGDRYENTFIGIGCKLEGWHYSSDEEIEGINQLANEQLSEDLHELYDQMIVLMAATSADASRNTNIQVINVQQNIALIRQSGLHTIAKASLNEFKASLVSGGFTDVQASVDSMKIGEEEVPCLVGNGKLNGMPIYYRQLWLLRGDFLVYITVISHSTDTTEAILSCYYPLP